MARSFRVYQKKRGNRRTGSKKLGSAGEGLFFALVLLVGFVGLVVLIATLVIPEWRANYQFIRHPCTVRDLRIGQKEGDDGNLSRPEVQIEYELGGKTYRVWTYDVHTVRGGGYSAREDEAKTVLDGILVGRDYYCYYDPADPGVAVLVRGSDGWVWLSFLIPVSFMLIGGGGLVHAILTWGKSTERRANLARRASRLGRIATNGKARTDFPYVPAPDRIADSPGTRLAFRLPVVDSSVGFLLGWLAASLLWNAVVAVFALVAVSRFVSGNPDWLLASFTLAFALVGIGLFVYFLRRVVVTMGIGPTLVEVSDQPLSPGGRYEVFLSQTGRLRVNWLEMFLVCEEETTFRHGTDARTETRRVYQNRMLREEAFEVEAGAPFEAACDVALPPGAMHSFKSLHNEVAWRILVRGSAAGWPDFERSFPLIVYPRPNGPQRP